MKKVLGYGAIAGLALWGLSSLGSSTSPTPSVQEEDSSYERTDDYDTQRSYEETGDMDCSDFSSQEEAQSFFEEEGGPDEDFHNLDRDGDGYVCETL